MQDAGGGAVAEAAAKGTARRDGGHVVNDGGTAAVVPARRSRGRGVAILVGGAVVVGLAVWKGGPLVHEMMTRVSTDDAYVAGDATQVAARVTDEVREVLVKDNDAVAKGAVLVRLDREPFRLKVEMAKAQLGQARLQVDGLVGALNAARADLEQASNEARGSLATLREAWRSVEGQQDQVRYRVASLRAEVAALRATQADATLAQQEYDRTSHLVAQQTVPRAELDQRQAALVGAREKVKAAEQKVQSARALLALPGDAEHPERVPADLDRSNVEVRRMVAGGQRVLVGLGVPLGMMGMEPEALRAQLLDLNGQTSEDWINRVPAVRAAKARVEQSAAALGGPAFDPSRPYDTPAVKLAEEQLRSAELDLGYTEIRAPVAGYVSRKAINPGDHVQAGQGLLAIQPLGGIYVVANFKETQLADLAIGQAVDLRVDAYHGKVFRGRVSGFAPVTGAASSVLPAENATGNFVKVVQRLPVRIDLVDPNPHDTPLLVGLSVEPAVDIKAEPTGTDAGQRLRGGEPDGLGAMATAALGREEGR